MKHWYAQDDIMNSTCWISFDGEDGERHLCDKASTHEVKEGHYCNSHGVGPKGVKKSAKKK